MICDHFEDDSFLSYDAVLVSASPYNTISVYSPLYHKYFSINENICDLNVVNGNILNGYNISSSGNMIFENTNEYEEILLRTKQLCHRDEVEDNHSFEEGHLVKLGYSNYLFVLCVAYSVKTFVPQYFSKSDNGKFWQYPSCYQRSQFIYDTGEVKEELDIDDIINYCCNNNLMPPKYTKSIFWRH